jgi:hypothetical protein
MGSGGRVRSSAWTWLFSSTQGTTARSGGFRYSPTTSRTFPTNCGSGDSLNVSDRCGCGPNARQIRPTVVRPSPLATAIPRVLQWVARAPRDRPRRPHEDLLDPLAGDRPRRAAPRLVEQPVEPVLDEPPPPPLADGRGGDA